MPAKTAAKKTEIKVKKADKVASLESVSDVLGKEHKKDINAMIAENAAVHNPPLLIVFKYLAPIKTCRP